MLSAAKGGPRSLDRCYRSGGGATDDRARRLVSQAFFERVAVQNGTITELTPRALFDALFSGPRFEHEMQVVLMPRHTNHAPTVAGVPIQVGRRKGPATSCRAMVADALVRMGAEGQGNVRFTATELWTVLGGASTDITVDAVRGALRRMSTRDELVEQVPRGFKLRASRPGRAAAV